MRNFLSASVLAVSALISAAPLAAQAKPLTQITFGVDATYPPFESLSPSGKFVGFDIDLGRAICAELKVKCVFVSQSFDGIIPALQARKFDAILSSMTVTPERSQQIDFTSEMYNEPTSLITKKGSGLKPTAASLKGKTVGVESGTIQESYAKAYWQPAGVNVISYPGQDQVYADLLSGRLDASLQDSVEADYGFLKTPKGSFSRSRFASSSWTCKLRASRIRSKVTSSMGKAFFAQFAPATQATTETPSRCLCSSLAVSRGRGTRPLT